MDNRGFSEKDDAALRDPESGAHASKRTKTKHSNEADKTQTSNLDNMAQNNVTYEEGTNLKMKKQVGVAGGVAFIVGTMIGSGIFISPKGVLRGTGSVAASLLVWTGCGVISLCAALCYAELGTMIPKSGSEFSYLMESLGPVPAFLQVWIKIVTSKTSSQAIISLTFARYVLAPLFDDCGPPPYLLKLLAVAVIMSVAIVNCYSAKMATRLQLVFMLIKVFALVVIIVGGIIKLVQGHTEHILTGFEGSETDPSVIAPAFYNGLWAFAGCNLPRSIMIALPLVMVVYLLTNVSYMAVLSKEALLASPAVAVSWGDRVLGSASAVIPFAVACSTFGALNGSIFTGGRLSYVAGRAGHFPAILSYVHVHQLTPWCSLIFTTIMATLMIIPGDIGSLINFISFTAWLIYGATFFGLIVLRFTRKEWNRPYKVPIVLPIVLVLISGYLVVAPILKNPRVEFLFSGLFVLCGLMLYVPFVHYKVKLRCMDSVIKWTQLFLQVAPSKYEP